MHININILCDSYWQPQAILKSRNYEKLTSHEIVDPLRFCFRVHGKHSERRPVFLRVLFASTVGISQSPMPCLMQCHASCSAMPHAVPCRKCIPVLFVSGTVHSSKILLCDSLCCSISGKADQVSKYGAPARSPFSPLSL